MSEPYLRVEGLVKRFGPFTALGGVDLEVYPGEVHALLGDNGAGKSTLIKTLAGVHQPTEGQLYIEGKPVTFRSPRDASAAGIGTVYQDLALNQLMSVTRNFFMGRELKGPLGTLRMDEMNQIAHDEMLKIGIDFSDPTQAVGTMSGGQRQTLAIARAIYFGAKVLILDEPTSALGQVQQMGVLKTVKRVKARGDIAIIFITHNEIHSRLVGDRFTFLALGKVIGSVGDPGRIRTCNLPLRRGLLYPVEPRGRCLCLAQSRACATPRCACVTSKRTARGSAKSWVGASCADLRLVGLGGWIWTGAVVDRSEINVSLPALCVHPILRIGIWIDPKKPKGRPAPMRSLFFTTIVSLLLPLVAYAQDHGHKHGETPYAGFETREIKSLSDQDIAELRRGGGWGLALPAELNGLPGPAHLLELQEELALTRDQVAAITVLFEDMQADAIEAGDRFIAAEAALSAAFKDAELAQEDLTALLAEAAEARAALRFVHLSRHLATPNLLSDEQIRKYSVLRGYSDDPCATVPEGHDPTMWRRHNGCDG
jgi:simple sugar transport system ATP-binding protein